MARLTADQMTAIKADILADDTLSSQPDTMDGAIAIASAYNLIVSPDYWVWRSKMTQDEITSDPSPDGTVWSWPAFIARSMNEIAGWQGIMGLAFSCNASLANVRKGFADIFSGGTPAAIAQRSHLMAICRRKATRAEKLFATTSDPPPASTGNLGTTTNVATMTFEGVLDPTDVYAARLLP